MAIYKPKRKISANGQTDDVKFPASCIEGLDEITGLKASSATDSATNVLMEENNKLVLMPLSQIKPTGLRTVKLINLGSAASGTLSSTDLALVKATPDATVFNWGNYYFFAENLTGSTTWYFSCNVYYSGDNIIKRVITLNTTSGAWSETDYTYSPSDTKVTQTVTTSNASYPLLLAPNGQTSTKTTTSYFDSGVTLNPSTNTIAANISGNAGTATKLASAKNIKLSGDASGTASFDGSGDANISVTVADDSHNHVISNVDGLQAALDGKAGTSAATTTTAGLMSATDKYRLDTLSSYLVNGHDDYVDSLAEVMAIFERYPQGTDIVGALSDKVDKVSGKGLSTNDFTAAYKTKVDNAVTTGDPQTISGNKTFTGQQTFTSDKFSLYVAGDNRNDSWFKFTDDGSTYYAFGIRRPYDSYGFQIKKHTTSGDSYYDIYHQGNYTKMPAATTSAAGLMSSTDKSKLDGIASGANNYSLPTASSSTLGGVKTGSNITNTSGTISLTKANVTGALGYTPPTTNTTYSAATTSAAGLMSAADKSKLDGLNGSNYLQKSGGSLNADASLKFSTYGTRFLTITGNSISADMSNETGGWAGNFASVKDPSGTTTSMLGWYGSATGLNHIYMGGTYSDPFMKMTPAGVFTFKNTPYVGSNLVALAKDTLPLGGGTMTGTIGLAPKKNSLYWTSASASQGYYAYSHYNDSADEGLVFGTGNNKVSFVFRNDGKTGWSDAGAALQIKNNTVAVNQTITGSAASYNLDVNGTANATTLYEGGTSLANKYQAKGSYAGTSAATQSAAGLMSAADKTKLDGIASGANAFSLPTRLASSSASAVTSADNATEQGWHYIGTSDSKRPAFKQVDGQTGNDYRVMTTAYSGSWWQQIATDFRSNDIFIRRNQNGTLQAWTPIVKMQQGANPCPTDNTIPRWDATRNATLQSSGITIDDSNNIGGIATLRASGDLIAPYVAATSAGHETGTYDKVATLSSSGYIRYRTKAELKADLGIPSYGYSSGRLTITI